MNIGNSIPLTGIFPKMKRTLQDGEKPPIISPLNTPNSIWNPTMQGKLGGNIGKIK
jgi:hypothetical protein